MAGPFGQQSLWDVITGAPDPRAVEAERLRQAELLRQQELVRQQAAARALAEQQRAQRPPAQGDINVRQMRHEPNLLFDVRNFAVNDVLKPVAAFAQGEGPVWDAAGRAVQAGRNLTGGMFETPASREAQAAQAKATPAAAPAAAKPQAFQQAGAVAPQVAAWNPFQNFVATPGQGPGAARPGGRAHQGRDYSGMSVGTPIPAPPLGAQLVGSGSDERSGNWGRWRLGDGRTMSIAHLTNRPTEEVVGPGKPMAFLGNSGNAQVRNPNNAVAHVRIWDTAGKEIDPAQAFGAGGAGGAQGGDNRAASVMAQIQSMNRGGPPVDETGFDTMDAAIKQAVQNAQGFETTFPTQVAPEIPRPQDQVAPDYAPADAAFAQARPTNPFGASPEEQEKNKLKMQRANYFMGLAKGLASFQEGTGLGGLFANLGGMALQGRLVGDETIRQKMEDFDSAMSKYNLAMASREEGKAKDYSNVANANIAQINRWTEQKTAQAMKEHYENKTHINEAGQLVRTIINPDGTTTIKQELVDPSKLNQMILLFGRNAVDRSNARSDSERARWAADEALFRSFLPQIMSQAAKSGDWQTADTARDALVSEAAVALVQEDTWQDAVRQTPRGAEAIDLLTKNAWANVPGIQLGKDGMPNLLSKPSDKQIEMFKNNLSHNLAMYFIENNQVGKLIGGKVRLYGERSGKPMGEPYERGPLPIVGSSVHAFREKGTRRTTRETAKGQLLDTITYSSPDE